MKVKFIFLVIVCALSYGSISAQAFKGDPFILQAYKELYNRQPNAWELNIFNYNNGSWASYNFARKYVQDFQTSMQRQNVKFAFGTAKGKGFLTAGIIVNNKLIAADIISTGGGAIVASGGANVLAHGGGTVTIKGGGSFKVTKDLAGFNFGSGADAPPKGTQRFLTSGPGAIIVK